PTAPLSSDEMSRYVGRPEEEARKLAHQIRHADGTILVSGYRGVGKSSFVNRVIFHARAAQKGIPSDGWLIVPITVNLAKVAGVQNILRLTLRSVRDALLDSDSPKAIPGHLKATPLPLSRENEIEPLEEAYIRATYKVTMSRFAGSERRSDIGTSISIDPGKWFGGRIVGVELGKFIEAGIKKTKTEKINRELSLLDFDENAAEESLGRLIRSLATPRPIVPGGPEVGIKLVFVFDELDKMDVETGLKPMIEGLKNLFLQQYSVFILVTSKGFYYELLKQRAIEDAMLSSYFSTVVHIPLLSYEEALKIVKDWVDLNAWERSELLPVEVKLLEQLTGALVYHSFGNPRDIIRELRLMQDWADTPDQPFLTDALSTPKLQIFSAIQDCIEKTILPQQQTSSVTTAPDGSVMLVAERLASDEARLEQARRGLYILTEELIDQQTLYLEPAPSTDKAAVLERIHRDNFSLFSLEEVRQLAKALAGYLKLVHNNADLFSSDDWGGSARPLFNLEGSDLQVTPDFYRLTGRQAGAATAERVDASDQTKTVEELKRDAEAFAASPDWSVKWAAINIIKRLGADNLTPRLKQFLWDVVRTDPDESHRLAAAERLSTKIDSEDEIKTITE
ncbi:MAG TPA: HEAT repeat domain-containing protein, partial [Pyrinomonadaceae bacterium]|nr:HEAT repeat domain-containing protein [Pyrinomonadaceae bacterium]